MRIDPPPPNRPSVSPTTAASATVAAISIGSPAPGQLVQCGAGGSVAALVPRHRGQRHAHRAGVAHRGDDQAAADRPRQPLRLRGDGAGEDAGDHEGAGSEADLPLELPRLTAAPDVAAGPLPVDDAAGEHRRRGEPGPLQRLLGPAGAGTGSADEDDVVVVQHLAQFAELVAQLVERDVDRTGDVPGLELGRGADVDQRRVGAAGVAEALGEGGGVDGAGHAKFSCLFAWPVRWRPAFPALSKQSSMEMTSIPWASRSAATTPAR